MNQVSHIVNDKIKFELKNGVLHALYYASYIDLELAKKIVAERKKYTKNKPVPSVITCEGRVEVTKEARKYFSTIKGTIGLTYVALVYENSISNKLLMSFMLKMHPPLVPTKIFKNKEKALSWIKTKTKTP